MVIGLGFPGITGILRKQFVMATLTCDIFLHYLAVVVIGHIDIHEQSGHLVVTLVSVWTCGLNWSLDFDLSFEISLILND